MNLNIKILNSYNMNQFRSDFILCYLLIYQICYWKFLCMSGTVCAHNVKQCKIIVKDGIIDYSINGWDNERGDIRGGMPHFIEWTYILPSHCLRQFCFLYKHVNLHMFKVSSVHSPTIYLSLFCFSFLWSASVMFKSLKKVVNCKHGLVLVN